MFEYSKYIDDAAKKYAENTKITIDEALDRIESLIFDSNCDVLKLIEGLAYPQPDVDFAW
ncbi:MAG: hypothetical protein IJI14_20070 [Anaerolineaceae bacterium]|nr:hypothetical protein [Anaerolineaceae bacterium]